jgi:excisionase family DNA binding protein
MIQGLDDRIPRVAYTIEEAAQALAVSARTVHRAIRRSELRAIHIGRSVRIAVAELESYAHGAAAERASGDPERME